MTEPTFIDQDVTMIVSEMVAFYEGATGKTLQPAQVEMLLINAFAYREQLVREQIQGAALQNLLLFSSAPIIDYLGDLVGVTRLSSAYATTVIEFTLTTNPVGVVIPSGTRVRTSDGRYTFATVQQLSIAASVLSGTVSAQAQLPGTNANGYGIGTVNDIQDALSYLSAASNTIATAGGSDIETDDQLRERIKLAPESFSVAGSIGSYIFWAKTASSLIIDVEVTSPVPGTVNIYPLMNDGSTTPAQILTAVYDICNADDIRPLTDFVQAIAPTVINYTLICNVTIYDTAVSATVQSTISDALADFVLSTRQKLGRDVTLDQLKDVAVYDRSAVYTASFGAFSDIVVDRNEFAFCGSITVNIVGTTAG